MTARAASGSRRQIPALVVFCLLVAGLPAAAQTPDDESWPDDEKILDVSRVNEGQLTFIAPLDDQPVLHSDTRLWLTAASLQSGWVEMQQCYRNFDAVDKTEIVYSYREMQDLQVMQAHNINRYRVRPRAIVLEGVGQDALLCLQARVRVLRRLADDILGMRHGPYHRRFLDGYYPYHLNLTVFFPEQNVRLRRVEPGAQDGFDVSEKPTSLEIESWFEGELIIELEFAEN